jgi:predicted acyltransferase
MASFHFFFTGKIFCTTYFLFSRHSMNASTAGPMHPKMLNHIGMFTPFATMSTWRISLSEWAIEMATRRIATMVVTGFMIGSFLEKSRWMISYHDDREINNILMTSVQKGIHGKIFAAAL